MYKTLSRLAVSFFMCVILGSSTSAPYSGAESTSGTLIVFVPTKDGLVVAADSRSNVSLNSSAQTIHCDDTFKIAILKHHERSVVAIGGTDKSFYFPSRRATLDNSCAYLKSVLPVLDSTGLVSAYLDRKVGEIDKNMLVGLRAYYLERVRAVQRRYPALLSSAGGESGLATVAVGQYLANRHVSIFASFRVCIPPNEPAVVCEEKWHEYTDKDECRVEVVGEAQFVEQSVLSDAGARLLGGRHLYAYSSFFKSKIVGNAEINRGKDAAIDLIQSSEILSDRIGSHTIGGPIHAVQLDEQHSQAFSVQ
jgi:hypothetical protein